VSRRAAGSPWLRQLLLMCAWVAGVLALGVWLIPYTPEGSWLRWAALVAAPVALVVGIWLIRGPRSSRLRPR